MKKRRKKWNTILQKSHNINQQLDKLEDELSKQSKFYSSLLEKLRGLQRQQQEDHHVSNEEVRTFKAFKISSRMLIF